MTYILNAIVAGAKAAAELRAGKVMAQLDRPSAGAVQASSFSAEGIRYLIVLEDKPGYWSSMQFASVPHGQDLKTTLKIPAHLEADVRDLLERLLGCSPKGKLVVYLEANRIVSRPPAKDDVGVILSVTHHKGLADLWQAIKDERFHEEEIHVVAS